LALPVAVGWLRELLHNEIEAFPLRLQLRIEFLAALALFVQRRQRHRLLRGRCGIGRGLAAGSVVPEAG
jgi:hypothetical protein